MRRAPALAAVIIGALGVVSPNAAEALDQQKSIGQYVLRSWETDDGLPQNSVSGIVQADDGFLWIGTRDGLCRFDGAHFTIFNRLNTPALPSNNITAIQKSADGSIWAGTDEGVVRYYNGTFTGFTVQDGLASNFITGISPNKGGVLVGTGLGLVRSIAGPKIHFAPVTGAPRGILQNTLQDSSGRTWFSRGRTLYRLDGDVAQAMPIADCSAFIRAARRG